MEKELKQISKNKKRTTEGAAPPTQDLHHHNLKQSLPKYSSQKNKNFTVSITEGVCSVGSNLLKRRHE